MDEATGYTLAPDLLDCDDAGYVTIRGSSIAVPDDHRELAEEVRDTCPEGAISLSDD